MITIKASRGVIKPSPLTSLKYCAIDVVALVAASGVACGKPLWSALAAARALITIKASRAETRPSALTSKGDTELCAKGNAGGIRSTAPSRVITMLSATTRPLALSDSATESWPLLTTIVPRLVP